MLARAEMLKPKQKFKIFSDDILQQLVAMGHGSLLRFKAEDMLSCRVHNSCSYVVGPAKVATQKESRIKILRTQLVQ